MGAQGQIAGALTTALEQEPQTSASRRTRRSHQARRAGPGAASWLLIAGIAALGAYAAFIAAGAPAGPGGFFDFWVYHLPIAAATGICLLRARGSRRLRLAWGAIAAGLLSWLLADLYHVEALQEMRRIPYPSWADLGYLLTIPCLLVGVRLMARPGARGVSAAAWLDGAIVALAVASVGAAILEPALTGLTHGDPAVAATNLAYPAGALILLSYLVGALTLTGWRRSPSLLALAAGVLVWAGADALYLYLTATGTYPGGWIDLLWPAGALAIGAAAMMRPTGKRGRARPSEGSVAIPSIAALAAVLVLLLDHWNRESAAAVLLASLTLVIVALRLSLGARENRRLVRRLTRDSVTDPLTGLGNRRKLYEELQRCIEERPGTRLALFDLDGFKAYNDAFGHTVGDALLRTFGRRLALAAAPTGSAYRLGGDEFCVLIDGSVDDVDPAVRALREALHECGQHFEIAASCGVVELGAEARAANEALRIADQRMYEEKGDRARTSHEQEAHDLLLGVLREHEPDLEGHVQGVGARAGEVAAQLGCDEQECRTIRRAAQLHDIGKVAIPETILRKPGPLSDEEWLVMRDHTLIGERILGSVSSLREVGALVRASHERWDGRGYPDGLAGEEIPLGSRIIFVCDAFDAMTEDRPYQRAKSEAEARAELERGAGSQFDPEVVAAFLAALDRNRPPAVPASTRMVRDRGTVVMGMETRARP